MGLLGVPRKYNPPGKHTPMEYPALLSRREMGLLKMHGGAGKKTKWGVPSFYMEASPSGSYRDSTPAQSGTRNTATSGGRSPGNPGTSPPGGGSGQGSDSHDSAMRSYGKQQVSQPSARTPSDSQLSRPTAPAMRTPQYTGDVKYPAGAFNDNNRMMQFGGYPTSYNPMTGPNLVNRVAPVPPGQKVTDYFSQPMALDPSILGRLPTHREAPQVVARIDDTGIHMVKDQSRLPGMDAPFDTRPNGDLTAAVTGEAGVKAYGDDPFGVTNLMRNPATLPGSYPNIAASVRQPKQFADRIAQQPNITAQNYGFQAPGPSPVDRRASYVNQWRDNQIANNAAHRGIGQPSSGPAIASIDPAGSSWRDDQPVNISPPGQDAIDRAAWANMQAQNDLGPQPPEQDLYARQNRVQQIASRIMEHLSPGPLGPGGQDRGDRESRNGQNRNNGQTPVVPPVTPPVAPPPPINPMAPWFYPEYQSQWAGLPQGQGGFYGRA